MMANPVVWFEIQVQDLARARGFYEAVLGVKLVLQKGVGTEMCAFPMALDKVGAAGALVKRAEGGSGGNGTVVYFGSADCAIEAGRVAAAGGRVVKEKASVGTYGYVVVAMDTEGNLFGVHSLT